MENRHFVTEAIRYQKLFTDSAFELWSFYQDNSEAMMQNTLNELKWIPEAGRAGYLQWNENNRQVGTYLKSIVDSGFEQVERVVVEPPVYHAPVVEQSPVPQGPVTPVKKAVPAKDITTVSAKTNAAPKAKASSKEGKGAEAVQSEA